MFEGDLAEVNARQRKKIALKEYRVRLVRSIARGPATTEDKEAWDAFRVKYTGLAKKVARREKQKRAKATLRQGQRCTEKGKSRNVTQGSRSGRSGARSQGGDAECQERDTTEATRGLSALVQVTSDAVSKF